MLKSIHLRNIKSHKDSFLNLSPGLNIICGDTDSGKSTVSRAFNWLISNQRGYSPRPWKRLKPKGESAVIVETSEGDVIERIKHTGINGYKLNGEVFKALGSDVPREIKDALRLKDINLQSQKNAYYLLNETGGAVAKEFNKIANLSNMDKAISSIQSRKVEKKQDIDTCKNSIKKNQQKLTDLEFVPIADSELIKLETRELELKTLKKNLELTESLKDRVVEAQSKVELLAPVKLFSDLKKLLGRGINWVKFDNLHQTLLIINGVKLVPDNLFSDFRKLTPVDSSQFNAVSKNVKDCRSVQIIEPSFFTDFDYINSKDLSREKLDTVLSQKRVIEDFDGAAEGYGVVLAEKLKELSALKATIKICKECGATL